MGVNSSGPWMWQWTLRYATKSISNKGKINWTSSKLTGFFLAKDITRKPTLEKTLEDLSTGSDFLNRTLIAQEIIAELTNGITSN